MRSFIVLSLISTLLATSLAAQSSQAVSGDPEVPAIQTKLTGIALGSPVKDLYLYDGQEYRQINFYPGGRSASVRYAGPQLLQLFEQRKNIEEGITYHAVANAQLKTMASDYLLFVSRTSAAAPVQMLAIPEDLSKFKVGSFRFINLTEKALAIKLGEARSLLKPQDYADLSHNYESGKSYETMIVELTKENQAPQRLFHSSLYFNKDARMLYLISDKGPRGIQLTGIPQVYRSDQ
jgi:hypothetical protein